MSLAFTLMNNKNKHTPVAKSVHGACKYHSKHTTPKRQKPGMGNTCCDIKHGVRTEAPVAHMACSGSDGLAIANRAVQPTPRPASRVDVFA